MDDSGSQWHPHTPSVYWTITFTARMPESLAIFYHVTAERGQGMLNPLSESGGLNFLK